MILTFIKFSDSYKKCGNESLKTLLVHSKWLQDQRWVNYQYLELQTAAAAISSSGITTLAVGYDPSGFISVSLFFYSLISSAAC